MHYNTYTLIKINDKYFKTNSKIISYLIKRESFGQSKGPSSFKALRIIDELVVGVALARPKGFANFNPAISTLMSTRSMGV